MTLYRLSAFSDGARGGNPAGVHLGDTLPDDADMQRIAADLGFSETAFAAPIPGGWRVRYARDPEGNLIAFQQNIGASAARSIDDMLWLKDRAPQ